MRDLGWLSVNRVTAASGSREQGGGTKRKRIEKVTWVETKTITTPTGEQQVRLTADGGRIGLGEMAETGEPVFVPLERVRTHRNPDKRGTHRWYNDYRLPERLGGWTPKSGSRRRSGFVSGREGSTLVGRKTGRYGSPGFSSRVSAGPAPLGLARNLV